MSTEILTTTTTTRGLSFPVNWSRNWLIFKGSCIKQKPHDFYLSKQYEFFIVCEPDAWSQDSNSEFTRKNCLFGDVKLAKTVDQNKYVYSCCGMGFDLRSEF